MHKYLIAILVLAHLPAMAQGQARTPWGDPDLQGTWDFTTITPLQRPPELAGKEFLSEREAAALEKQINQQRVQTEETSPGALGGVPRPETDPGIYNLGWWWEPNGRRLVGTRRTSLVVDPIDGRIPPLTPQAEAIGRRRDAVRELRRAPSDLPLAERCIMGFNSGPPMIPGPYNNLVQILVETRNLSDNGTGTFGLPGLTDRNARLVERFTRSGDRGLVYRFTITDSTVWSRAWGAEVPMTRVDGFVMEYACHEGNYGLANILAGARAEEKVR